MSGFGRFQAVLVALCVALAGCGGGGGGGGGDEAPKAEGAYAVNGDDGSGMLLLVLENDELWGVYRLAANTPGGNHGGFFHGQGSSGDGAYAVSELRDYNFLDERVDTLSLDAQFVPGVSFDATVTPVTPAGSAFTLPATRAAVGGYDYEQAATSAAIAGAWNGFYGRSGETGTVTVSADGTATGNADACNFEGTMRPRPSGKNVYDVHWSLGSGCNAPAGTSLAGIAFINFQQLVVMIPFGDGITFVGTR